MKMESTLCALLAVTALMTSIQSSRGAAEGSGLRFVAGENNEFVFDTGVLRGKLRAGGRSAGLSSVVHIPTGMRIDASMGLFSHYRLFSTNKRYGTAAWDMPSSAKLASDGSVEVCWSAAADRPFELSAIYRWAAPNVLDVETGVHAQTNLVNFESFLASYFNPGFTNAAVCAGRSDGSRFMPADRSAGVWLAFPRDDKATGIIKDGRWKFEPNPVDWEILPHLRQNLAFRRCPGNALTSVLMSPREDCFAILTPFQTEPHYSMYLSLFGRDLKAGQSAQVRARLVVAPSPSEAEMVKMYQEYLGR